MKWSKSKCSVCKGKKYTVDEGGKLKCAFCEGTGFEPTAEYYARRIKDNEEERKGIDRSYEISDLQAEVAREERMMESSRLFGEPTEGEIVRLARLKARLDRLLKS